MNRPFYTSLMHVVVLFISTWCLEEVDHREHIRGVEPQYPTPPLSSLADANHLDYRQGWSGRQLIKLYILD